MKNIQKIRLSCLLDIHNELWRIQMIKIMADSTCDLSQEILDKYDISLASLLVTIDGKEYRDRIDITPGLIEKVTSSLSK